MATYLLTWNPDTAFQWEDISAAAERAAADGVLPMRWSFGNRTKAEIGDRVFLIKQGKSLPKGIVASGYLASEPYVDEHWNDRRKDANYVQANFDVILDPETDSVLDREFLQAPEFALMHWDTQASGTLIPPGIAGELESLWAEVVKESGKYAARHSTETTPREGTQEPVFGEVPGYPPGSEFDARKALSDAYIHRPLQTGIWGKGAEGAYSIILSGGYVDDKDYGDEIIYTGQGGRDQGTGRQVFDQTLTLGNLALAKSHAEGLPVRVTRGHQHRSRFSPATGYAYAGLYRVS